MSSSQFISVRETAQLLGITEKKVMDLIDDGTIQAYRIANQFLRLKKSEVINLRSSGSVENENVQYPYTRAERIKDFFYYNDFYIFSSILILILLFFIYTGS